MVTVKLVRESQISCVYGHMPRWTKSLAERFWAKVDRCGPKDCWLWTAAKMGIGYGAVWDGKILTGAHRVSWRLHNGTIPKSKFILHKCDVPACVNPAHLYIGTPLDNMLDKVARGRDHNKIKTHCPKGHPYSGDNLILRKNRNNARDCRTCQQEAIRRWKEKWQPLSLQK